MKKMKFLLWCMAIAMCTGFTACSSDSSDDSNETPGGNDKKEEVTPPTPDNMKYAALSGVVTDGYQPINGVKVVSGAQSTTTGLNGSFSLDKMKVENGRVVVSFEKEGFMSVTRSFPQSEVNRMTVAMKRIDATATINTSYSTPVTISMSSYSSSGSKTMKVELPTSYKNGNSPYNGEVKAEAVYLNPDNEKFASQMPGDLTTNEDKQLVSLGMVAVDLTGSNGEKLELGDGQKAKLIFPVPDNKKEDAPQTMPLWSFNESTGLWEKEEGVATYDPTLNAYVGEVSHFSWHNLDYEMTRATLKVKVVDSNDNPVYDVPVDIDGEREINTDKNGIATCLVPSDTKLYVRVKSEDYGNYAMDYSEGWGNYDASKEAKLTNVKLDGGSTKTVTLKLPAKAPQISGHIINEGSGSKVCSVYITFGMMQQTQAVVSDLNGAFITYGPASYKGKGKVVALFGDGTMAEQEFELDGTDKVVDVTVNNSSTSGAGIIQVTGNGYKFNYNLTDPISGTWSKNGTNLRFSLQDLTEEMAKTGDHMSMYFHYFSINIENYDESKSEFDGDFHFATEGHGGGHVSLNSDKQVKITVTKSGDKWTFKMKGIKGDLYDQNRNIDDQKITFDAEFSATVTESAN
ncbi:MAG: carboxypeptidase regulatory-like domain-containing protein [Prevotella sp.]|nr:carboxypeptidase regulatory-like domain-containing protein [Prevotella sp.]